MSRKIFISYCHRQGDWVWQRLVPCLKAGGAEVLIDVERFKAGFGVIGQMNDEQDGADLSLLVLTREYFERPDCLHEMQRAIARDPNFANGSTIPVIREACELPDEITWVFAGSHEITELEHAAWTSYLVSARTIEVPFFTLLETRLPLTDPVKHSTLWRNNPDRRPRFDASFWGEGGIERIQREAGGWPHLVQLIAETIVDLLNYEEQATTVTPDLMEQALDKAVVRGHNVLYVLLRRESFLPGEWEYLLIFRKMESQPPPQDEQIAFSLRRRLLVEEVNGEWRLRVPLMACWLKSRGQ